LSGEGRNALVRLLLEKLSFLSSDPSSERVRRLVSRFDPQVLDELLVHLCRSVEVSFITGRRREKGERTLDLVRPVSGRSDEVSLPDLERTSNLGDVEEGAAGKGHQGEKALEGDEAYMTDYGTRSVSLEQTEGKRAGRTVLPLLIRVQRNRHSQVPSIPSPVVLVVVPTQLRPVGSVVGEDGVVVRREGVEGLEV
jgi:hypothetical protein